MCLYLHFRSGNYHSQVFINIYFVFKSFDGVRVRNLISPEGNVLWIFEKHLSFNVYNGED